MTLEPRTGPRCDRYPRHVNKTSLLALTAALALAGCSSNDTDKAEDAYGDIKPSKIQQFKAKRKVNSVVGDLQDQLDDLQPSALDKFAAKRKVNKASTKAQNKAQDAVDSLQNCVIDTN